MKARGLRPPVYPSRLRLPLVCLLATASLAAASPPAAVPARASAGVATGRLAVCATNPHYLQDASGKPLVLIGYNSEWKKQPGTVLDRLVGKVNYLRTAYASNSENKTSNNPADGNPFVRTAGGLWDFDTWDERFWKGLKRYLDATSQRGLIVGFNIWDGHTALPGGRAGDVSIWNAGRNLQGVQWAYDTAALQLYDPPDRASSNPAERLVYYQRRFVDRFIAEVKGYPNVLVELDNETDQASEGWFLWWADYFIHNGGFVIATTWKSDFTISDGTFAVDPRLHMKSYHERSDEPVSAARYSWNKVIVADADVSGTDMGADQARRIAWNCLVRGGHWNDYMEDSSYPGGSPFPNATKLRTYGNLLRFLKNKAVPFWRMAPRDDLVSTGHALVEPGMSYLAYVESDVTVNLSGVAGTYAYSWYDPRSGLVVAKGKVVGGGPVDLHRPGGGDWVLWIKKTLI